MALITVTGLALLAVSSSFAATFQGEIDEHTAYPGHCYFKHDGGNQITYFKPGSTGYDTDACIRYMCASASQPGKVFISGHSCGVVAAQPPCYVTGVTKGRNYPECCPTIECPDEAETATSHTANELFTRGSNKHSTSGKD